MSHTKCPSMKDKNKNKNGHFPQYFTSRMNRKYTMKIQDSKYNKEKHTVLWESKMRSQKLVGI